MIEAPNLSGLGSVTHGFFTRAGGKSRGIYAGLNTGLGSDDDRATVEANRDCVRRALNADSLLTPYQIHSPDAIVATAPWPDAGPPRGDALVTATPGIAIAVNTADCTPVLFANEAGTVIAAAHAGWKGAVSGILQSTVQAMTGLGAEPGTIHAAIGPTISRANYEVGPEFRDRFIAQDGANDCFFTTSQNDGRFMFDLPGYVEAILNTLGLASIWDARICTYANEDEFFSYRRTTHRSEPDYGRQMSAIVISQ